MKKTVENIKNLTESFLADMEKAAAGKKYAGVRARKTSILLEKEYKEFRKLSIAEGKN